MRVKIILRKKEIITVLWHYPSNNRYHALNEFIQKTFQIKHFKITFTDDDDDHITILNEQDIHYAFINTKESNKSTVKFYIDPIIQSSITGSKSELINCNSETKSELRQIDNEFNIFDKKKENNMFDKMRNSEESMYQHNKKQTGKFEQHSILKGIFDISSVSDRCYSENKFKIAAIKQMQSQYDKKRLPHIPDNKLKTEFGVRTAYIKQEKLFEDFEILKQNINDELQQRLSLKKMKEQNLKDRHKKRNKLILHYRLWEYIIEIDNHIEQLNELLITVESYTIEYGIIVKNINKYYLKVNPRKNELRDHVVANHWLSCINKCERTLRYLEKIKIKYEMHITSKSYNIGSLDDIKRGYTEQVNDKKKKELHKKNMNAIKNKYTHKTLNDKKFKTQIYKKLTEFNDNVEKTINYFKKQNVLKAREKQNQKRKSKQEANNDNNEPPKKKRKIKKSKNNKSFTFVESKESKQFKSFFSTNSNNKNRRQSFGMSKLTL